MNSQERVLSALRLQIPDKVPFMYASIDHSIREQILGEKISYDHMFGVADWSPIAKPGVQSFLEPYEVTDARVARKLGLDAIGIQYMTPVFADVTVVKPGHAYIKKSLIETPDDLKKVMMPDVDDEKIYQPAIDFVNKYKGEFALYCRIRLGISPTLNSMGMEAFSYNMADDPDFVKEVVQMFTEWAGRHIKNLMEIGFDFLWSFDDMAHKSAALFSGETWDEFFFPYLKKAADCITIPWIFHSDGNLMPMMDRIIKLGMNGLHPLEPGAMDLVELKRKYGQKLCLVGNVDIDHTLTSSTLEEVDATIKEKMDILGSGGGFIISDSNSIPDYCKVENIFEMAKAVEKYRYIY